MSKLSAQFQLERIFAIIDTIDMSFRQKTNLTAAITDLIKEMPPEERK